MIKISTDTKKDLLIQSGIILSLVAVLFLGFFFVYLPFSTNHGEAITVPELKEMKVDQLETYLDNRDLRYEISDCTFVANRPPLTVITQYPQPGAKVKEGRKIYVTVTTATVPFVKMPKLTDMTLRSAKMLLKSAGLVEGELKYVPDLAQNAVLKQFYNGKEVLPNQQVPKGSRIDLEVGNGLGTTLFSVPNIVGMPFDEAEFQILGAGLKVGQKFTVKKDEEYGSGVVVRQNPAANNQIRIGDVIDVWVTPGDETSVNGPDEQILP